MGEADNADYPTVKQNQSQHQHGDSKEGRYCRGFGPPERADKMIPTGKHQVPMQTNIKPMSSLQSKLFCIHILSMGNQSSVQLCG
jgi:hypothetical protein